MTATFVTPPLPDWVREVRAHQIDAVAEAVEHYRNGIPVVFLDGPTGTGKTLIAELIARELDTKALYVCTDKQLQDQFAGDFPYAKVLKGRANYPTTHGGPDVTADDCTGGGRTPCIWCEETAHCPYRVAKGAAANARLAVLNTAYLMAEANTPKPVFSARPFIIADEADQLEGALLNYIEYSIQRWAVQALRLQIPKKGAHKPTLYAFLESVAEQARAFLAGHPSLEPKHLRLWERFVVDTNTMIAELGRDIARGAEGEGGGRWIRSYDTKTFKMVPVTVGSYGPKRLWRHGRRWLLMSATLISPDQMADELGLPFRYEVVQVPMTFPVENRPIYLASVANITYKAEDIEFERLATAIERIADKHPRDRILVHTVSYNLTKRLIGMLRGRIIGRPLVHYEQARDKQSALARYRRGAASILFAPSVTRGVDLTDDDCRVMVVAKVPFPSFGDQRIAARTRLPGGEAWYMVRTIREIVQMTGRGVRSANDYAITYILDSQFASNPWRRGRHLFPQWWKEAVDLSFNPRQLM
jgi:Rad3-related DNA helicase